MARRWQGAALLPLLAAVAACSGTGEGTAARQDEAATASSDPILSPNSPVALTPYWPEGGAAMISGRLMLEGGCLYLRQADGRRLLPTFPWPGTHWEPKDETLTIFGRHHYRVGQPLSASGGFVTQDGGDGSDVAALQRMLVAPRPQCDVTRVAVLYFGESGGGEERRVRQ